MIGCAIFAGLIRRRLDVILRELALEQPFAPETKVDVVNENTPSAPSSPSVMEDIVRVVGEALFNAALHAHATQVQVKIYYGSKRLQVQIGDNGVGIASKRLAWAAREGHYGLLGMQERAAKDGRPAFGGQRARQRDQHHLEPHRRAGLSPPRLAG